MRLYRNKAMLVFMTMILVFVSIVLIFNDSSKNNITGYDIVNTKVTVFPTVYKNCSFDLYPGWNLVSFYCLGMYNARSTVLQSIDGKYDSIFEYQSNDLSDPWKSYSISLPNWTVQQLNYMDRISGYWIYIYNTPDSNNVSNDSNVSAYNITFSYAGVYSDSVISLYDGWNLVGYPNTKSVNISAGLNGLSYSIVKYYNTTTDTWVMYLNNSVNNTLDKFETYKGYWVNVNGDQQWHIVR